LIVFIELHLHHQHTATIFDIFQLSCHMSLSS
jgi:hypothetical protein